MGKRVALVLLLLLCLESARSALGGQVRLEWDPNAEPNVAGYRVYYGFSSGDYTMTVDAGNATTRTIDGLADGRTCYFAVAAYDSAGRESGYSNQVAYTPPVPESTLSADFESAAELDSWDSGGSGARLELAVGEWFEGDSSLAVSGGSYQAARRTFAGLTVGQTAVISGAVKVVGTTSPVNVVLKGGGGSDWAPAEFTPNGSWQYFAVPKTITRADAAGLEVSIAVYSPAATVYLDSLTLSEDLYRSDFPSKAGWDNGVYQVYGGAVLRRVASGGVDGSAALRMLGGTSQAGRFTILGLPVGAVVTFSGWVSSASAEPVVVRMNGIFRTDWTQTSVAAGGGARFNLTKTVTELDAGGLDFNVILRDPSAVLFLDDVLVSLTEPANHAVTASSGPHGSIEPPGTTLVGEGASQIYSIVPDHCYQVASAEASDGTIGNFTSHVFSSVSRDETITASFEVIRYAIDASASGGGAISSPGVSHVNCRESKTYIFTPEPGKQGARLVIGGMSQPYAPVYTFPSVASDQSIAVEFESVPVPVVSAGFESAVELDSWDSGGSGARLELAVGEWFEGDSSLVVSGGSYQAARRTFAGLTVGQTVVISGAVKVVGTTNPVVVVLKGGGNGDGAHAEFTPNGRWQYFAVPKTITSLDAAGLEVSIAVYSPAATVYLDSLTLSGDLYRSDFPSKAGWDNGVYQVYGGAVLRRVASGGVDGSAALRLLGGTIQGGRFTILGLPVGAAVTFSGWVSSASAVPVVVRMNGLSMADWTQTSVAAGDGARFSLTKTVTDLDAAGLDLNVILRDPAAELLLDDVKLELAQDR